jgi:hypothetical protein
MLIDRSMNDNLMLQNSSFETSGIVGNRSRSFAKTGALTQQNSRDVIVGTKQKKQTGNMGANGNSKSQGKQKANKELLNFLNQGSTGTKSSAHLQGSNYISVNPQMNMDDYKKQMLVKKALENQAQQLRMGESRSKNSHSTNKIVNQSRPTT